MGYLLSWEGVVVTMKVWKVKDSLSMPVLPGIWRMTAIDLETGGEFRKYTPTIS